MGEVKQFPLPGSGTLNAPERITPQHDLSGFDCGVPQLNDWLRKRALRNETGASRTYVVSYGPAVVGYYAIATGSVFHDVAVGRVKRNMPDPVPVMVLGRLAVDHRWHGQGIGAGMLKSAVHLTLRVSELVGVRALLVHAKDENAKAFYLSHDFDVSPIQPMTLMITLDDAKASFP